MGRKFNGERGNLRHLCMENHLYLGRELQGIPQGRAAGEIAAAEVGNKLNFKIKLLEDVYLYKNMQ